jgi:ubiquinone/menaquinone biosynthesis C-methylase UbiE
MSLKEELHVDSAFSYKNNIFYQKNFQLHSFEESYLKLREKEDRIYDDSVVKQLPDFNYNHLYKQEWNMRKSTLHYLIKYLRKNEPPQYIMELGCGNGWLAHNLAASLDAEICAVDVNEIELLQGARIFKDQQNLCFVYTDIFSSALKAQKFNAIVLAGSVQYFGDVKGLIARLFEFMDSSGKIYIADSPIYSSRVEAEAARKRSIKYFSSLGSPEMAEQYFHHAFDELKDFNYKILHNPKSVVSLLKRKILKRSISILPILCVTK